MRCLREVVASQAVTCSHLWVLCLAETWSGNWIEIRNIYIYNLFSSKLQNIQLSCTNFSSILGNVKTLVVLTNLWEQRKQILKNSSGRLLNTPTKRWNGSDCSASFIPVKHVIFSCFSGKWQLLMLNEKTPESKRLGDEQEHGQRLLAFPHLEFQQEDVILSSRLTQYFRFKHIFLEEKNFLNPFILRWFLEISNLRRGKPQCSQWQNKFPTGKLLSALLLNKKLVAKYLQSKDKHT